MVDYSFLRVSSSRRSPPPLALPSEPEPSPSAPRSKAASTRLTPSPALLPHDVHAFVDNLLGDDLHAKRVLSLASGVVGVLHSASLAISSIGQGLAQAQGLAPKHATKQIDRLLSNKGLVLDDLLPLWVGFVLAQRPAILVTLDWTDFDDDDQSTLALNLVTTHGRATPLVWKTVIKSKLKDWRNRHEDELLERFHDMLPLGVHVTLLADRGFGDQKLYTLLGTFGFDFVIRFRGVILVTLPDGTSFKARDLVPANGRPKLFRDVTVTAKATPVAGVVCVRAPGMKDPWHLATSLRSLTASQLVGLYGRRFSTEENFRDTKDPRFGLGLSATHLEKPERRDRLLLLSAMAQVLLTMLGAASEEVGLDRMLKVNTAKKRTHSLFRQGMYWYGALRTMPEAWLRPLMESFGKLVSDHPFFSKIFGVI